MGAGDVDDRRQGGVAWYFPQCMEGILLDFHVRVVLGDREQAGDRGGVAAATQRAQQVVPGVRISPRAGERAGSVPHRAEQGGVHRSPHQGATDRQHQCEQHRQSAGEPARERLHRHGRHEPPDPLHQGAARGRHGEGRHGIAEPLHAKQRGRIAMRVAAHGYCQIVAAVLALVAHAARHPPHDWMIEQQRLDR